jgi:hypothetical protein
MLEKKARAKRVKVLKVLSAEEKVDEQRRLVWAHAQMEEAYRRELGLEPAAERSQGGKKGKKRARKALSVGVCAGEHAAAETENTMSAVMSDYEMERAARIDRNRAIMAQPCAEMERQGIPVAAAECAAPAEEPQPAEPRAPKRQREEPEGPARRSCRARTNVKSYAEGAALKFSGSVGGASKPCDSVCSIHGVPATGTAVGALWLNRAECNKAGVHAPYVAGIHSSGHDEAWHNGAYSVALTGAYEGDVDLGDEFTYTGNLRSNKRTAPQDRDQLMERGNKALAVNMWRELPLRVLRGGFKLASAHAPAAGLRYDGLYDVKEVWPELGASGYVIWRFRMKRRAEQAAAPWAVSGWQAAEAATIATLKEAAQTVGASV